MPLTTMTIVMFLILFLSGAFDEVGNAMGLKKSALVYFFICCAALYGFDAVIVPEVELNPACLLVTAAVPTLAAHRYVKKPFAVLLVAALAGLPMAAALMFFESNEVMLCACAALPALCVFSRRELCFDLAAAAAAPVFAALLRFLAEMIFDGYGCLILDAAAADMQFVGMLAVCAAYEAKMLFKRTLGTRGSGELSAGHRDGGEFPTEH